MGVATAAIVAREEQIVPTLAVRDPGPLDQSAIIGRIVGWNRRDEIQRGRAGGEGQAIGGHLLHLHRPEPRTPVEQPPASLRVVEQHQVDVDEARAAQERCTDVGEGTFGAVRGRHGETQSSFRILERRIGLGRIVEEVAPFHLRDMRRPEVLRPARPGGLHRQRITEVLPAREVRRAGDLDVDLPAFDHRLGGIGIVGAILGAEHGRVGEIGVDGDLRAAPRLGDGRHAPGKQPCHHADGDRSDHATPSSQEAHGICMI